MLPTQYQEYIALSRYARWLPKEERRETWSETCWRYVNYWKDKDYINQDEAEELYSAIYNLEAMPSMRALMTAGVALDRDNVAGFNCSYAAVDHIRVFDEILYILMCGTGVGFSVERQYINQLPAIAEELRETETTITVHDSKIGWAKAYRELISLLYAGAIPKWDTSKVRPAGAVLKTFGGRASGPGPLEDLFQFTVDKFKDAEGRKLTSIECHDIVCKIAEIVVVGGVRRSALISLSNLTDQRMALAKSGSWWDTDVQRALANNSICFTEKPDVGAFMREWNTIYESKSGERGIFNRVAAQVQAAKNERRDSTYDFGTNPCSEIILRPGQFCNLSEVVVRSGDSFEDLKRKVRWAAILGTLQATLTDFRYLRKVWKNNTEEEALLGVSLTGIMDHPVLSGSEYQVDNGEGSAEFNKRELQDWLNTLREVAIETNKEWAEKLGINPSTAITAVKPSGTVSQLVDSASGIHPRYSEYYIRTVRGDKKDPLHKFMVDKGFPVEDDVTKPDSTYVFSFPVKGPHDAVFRNDRTAIEQLEHWLVYQRYWCEHKPSVTIYVKDHEWPEVGAWVWNHFDEVSGVSFLPHTNHSYKQAPYQEIDEDKYNELVELMPTDIDWSELSAYEAEDYTIGSQEYACVGGSCEIN